MFLRKMTCLFLCLALGSALLVPAIADEEGAAPSGYPGEAWLKRAVPKGNPVLAVNTVDEETKAVTVTVVVPDYYNSTGQLYFQPGIYEDARLVREVAAGSTFQLTFEELAAGQYAYLSVTVGPYLQRDRLPPFSLNFANASILAFGVDEQGKALPSYLLTVITRSGATVLAMDPTTGKQIKLSSAEVVDASKKQARPRKHEAGKEKLRVDNLEAATPYRLTVTAADGSESPSFLFRSAKNPRRRRSAKEVQEAQDALVAQAEAILGGIPENGPIPDHVIREAEKWLDRYDDEVALLDKERSQGPSEGVVSAAELDKLRKSVNESALTYDEQIGAVQAQVDLLKPITKELKRLLDKRVCSSQALADYLDTGAAAELTRKLMGADVTGVRITLEERDAEGDAKNTLVALIGAIESQTLGQLQAALTLYNANDIYYHKEDLYSELGEDIKLLAELKKAWSKSRGNLSDTLAVGDSSLNGAIEECLQKFEESDAGMVRSIPAGVLPAEREV